jgi:dihydrofolate synthase / folylpolyglutamate synthase
VTYEESLAWLYATQQFGIKLGLENIRGLLEALGNPQERLSMQSFEPLGDGRGFTLRLISWIFESAFVSMARKSHPRLSQTV